MTNEIQVGAQVLTGAEVLIATLAAWHPFVDVYVDGSADPRVIGSVWNLYAVTAGPGGTRTRIASGVFTNAAAPLEGQQVLSKVRGAGDTIELRAFSPNGSSGGAIRGAIVGWDPSSLTTNPEDSAGQTFANIAPGAEVVVAAVPWHPVVTAFVQAGAQALGSTWRIKAVIAGFGVNVPIAQGLFGDVDPSRVVCGVDGAGASSWQLTASAPAGSTGAVTGAFSGYSPPGTTGSVSPAEVLAALAANTNPVDFNGQRLTNIGAPLAPTDAATRIFSITGPVSATPAALAIDWSLGNAFAKTIAANSVFTFSNAADGQTITIAVTAGAGNTVTWPAVLWPGGAAPTQTSSGTDVYTFIKIGVAIYGSAVQAMA